MSSRLSTSESPRQAYWFGAAFFCIVVSIFLAACGANEPEDREGGTLLSWTESTRRLLHRPSASIQVSPSGQDQVLTVLGVGVTIPGALLGTPQPLSVTALSDANLSRPMPEMQTVGVYDITLGSMSTFDKPLVLEFAYNAAALGDGAAQGKNLWVAYWDMARQQWVRANATVDTARQKIAVSTDHLSTWWIYRMRGYDYVPKGRMSWFEVYFNPKHVNPRSDVVGQSMQGLAEDVLAALETARENYKTAGFKVPLTTASVFIADVPDSNWGKWGGSIDLKRSELVNLDRIRSDSAHELFHAVQNQYYFFAGLLQRFWFTEGTPDFMAYRYGWNGSIQSQIEPLTLSWFEDSPFENLTDVDAYPLGNFLRYLNQVEGVDIKKLWDYMAPWPINVPQAFRSGVLEQTKKSFDDVWRNFVYDAMFGATALAKAPYYQLLVDKNSTDASKQLTLKPNYTAKLVGVTVRRCNDTSKRFFKISTPSELTGSSQVRLWSATPDGLNPVYLGSFFGANREITKIPVDDSVMVFAIADNTGATENPVTLTVTADDCAELPSFSKTYPGLELYNRDIVGDVQFSMSGAYSSFQEYAGPGFAFVRFKVPTPAPATSMVFNLTANVSGLKCNGCTIESYSWNEFGTGSGGTVSLLIDDKKCSARGDFYVKFKNRTTGAMPLAVDIDGCP